MIIFVQILLACPKITKLDITMNVVIKTSREEYDSPKISVMSIRAERGFAGSGTEGGMYVDDMREVEDTWD